MLSVIGIELATVDDFVFGIDIWLDYHLRADERGQGLRECRDAMMTRSMWASGACHAATKDDHDTERDVSPVVVPVVHMYINN